MDIRKWTFEIAEGTASAVMRQGSFHHKDEIRRRRPLFFTAEEEACTLTDKLTKTVCRLSVTKRDIPDDGPAACHVRKLHIDLKETGANRLFISFPAPAKEQIFGCGETFSELDLKGHRMRIWVAEHQNARTIAGKMIQERIAGPHPERKQTIEKYESYYAQPTFQSDLGYFLHVDGNGCMEFDFRDPRRTVLMIRLAENDRSVDLYYGEADTFEGRSAGIASLLGMQPRLPGALLDGVILASQEGNAKVEEKIALAKAYDLPLTGVWCQDWCGCRRTRFGYQVMWNWQWDPVQYPDLPAKIRAWKEQGVSFYGYINPFLAVEGPLYAFASEKGYLVKDAAGSDYMVTITTFPAAMVDFTNPAAYSWYKEIIKREMIGIGMEGWMADFGEYLPADAVLFSGVPAMDIHNYWPAIWARLNGEAIEECGKTGKVFFFTRAGHTGTIRYSPMMWNGDQHVDWSLSQGIGSVIPASLSLAMSGIGVCHSDIGGYTSIMHMQRSKELLMRWTELSCFSPLMRLHEGNRPDVNVQFDEDEESLRHLARFGRLHKALKGYLEETLEAYYTKGIPVMRPLAYHYRMGTAAAVTDEYLLGRDILAAPVLMEGAVQREVLLPEDSWIHLFTGKRFKGGSHTVPSPMGCPPVFIREASPYAEQLGRVFRDA
ncbi:MAG: alpha-glucosidase [Clostridiales bacterium]|nr:alpha-glucosidase [Clostridiales bacterium]